MAGPNCVNARDWSFLVAQDRDTLNKMADANGHPAEPLRKAALGILVLGDLERAFSRAQDYWLVDGAIAAENMILAANALGIGSVWLVVTRRRSRKQRAFTRRTGCILRSGKGERRSGNQTCAFLI